VWDHVYIALSPQGDELSPRGSWGICVPVLPEGLTGLVSPLVKYKWREEQQRAFEEIKQKVSQETLLTFTDFE
jgi:hypothetical protein